MTRRVVDALIVQLVRQYLELSCRGRDAAQTKDAIALEIGLLLMKHSDSRRVNTRAVELAVHAMREAGAPVGSSGAGYFWCVTRADAEITAAHIRPRFASMKVSYENAMSWAGRLPETIGAAQPAVTGNIF